MLEETVDEKYYLSDDRLKGILKWEERQKENGRGFRFDVKDGDGIARTMTTSSDRPADSTYVSEKPIRLGGLYDKDGVAHQAGSVYSVGGGRSNIKHYARRQSGANNCGKSREGRHE